MFGKRKWYWIVATLFILGIGGIVFLRPQIPQEAVKIYKVVKPNQILNKVSKAETKPETVVDNAESADVQNTVVPENPTSAERQKRLQIQIELDRLAVEREQLTATLAALKEELAAKKEELAAAQALEETANWMREFRPQFKTDLAEIRNVNLSDMSLDEKLTLLEKALEVDDNIEELWERIATLPPLARDQVLEKIRERSNPAVADYVLEEISSRIPSN